LPLVLGWWPLWDLGELLDESADCPTIGPELEAWWHELHHFDVACTKLAAGEVGHRRGLVSQ
jgi:hypothetical protein